MKKFLWLVVCIVLCSNADAQLLYEISGKGLNRPSYILGTHHAVPVSSLTQVDNVFRCYNRCDAVVGEIVVADDTAMVARMSEAAMMNGLITDFISVDDAVLLDSLLYQVVGLRLNDVAHLRPAMIQNIYEMTLYEQAFPDRDDNTAMDSFFQQIAIEQGKSVFGLETIDQQIDLLFRSHTVQDQAKILMNTVKHGDNIRADVEKLNRLYLRGDIDSLYDWLIEMDDYSVDDIDRLVVGRNKAWIDKLERYIGETSCFIAVGALHLPGKTGVLELLRKRGYRVKAVA